MAVKVEYEVGDVIVAQEMEVQIVRKTCVGILHIEMTLQEAKLRIIEKMNWIVSIFAMKKSSWWVEMIAMTARAEMKVAGIPWGELKAVLVLEAVMVVMV